MADACLTLTLTDTRTRGLWRPLSGLVGHLSKSAGHLLLVACTILALASCSSAEVVDEDVVRCNDLQIGQYVCQDPIIDPVTQSARNCPVERVVKVDCMPVAGTQCDGEVYNGTTVSPTLRRVVPCRHTNGYSYNTSLLLSIFLGMFGVDRLYLGYPALALIKFCTVGLLFIGQFLDVLLIAMQVVGPADGSDYIINYYGPVLQPISLDNDTYYMPIAD